MQMNCKYCSKSRRVGIFEVLLISLAFLAFAGCNGDYIQNAMNAEDESGTEISNLNKGRVFQFPLTASKTYHFIPEENVYSGGAIHLAPGNGSTFHVEEGALTPPAGVPFGESVTITMEVAYDSLKQELLFTFGPSGCFFGPPARIKLDYSALGIENPQLYYIDSEGNYIPQSPAQINTNQRFMIIYIDHFSRYALAYS